VRVAGLETAQLPLERMVPQSVVYINNKEGCIFCQYFLHYVQQAITNPRTEVLHGTSIYFHKCVGSGHGLKLKKKVFCHMCKTVYIGILPNYWELDYYKEN
jgi:hypothetical protein